MNSATEALKQGPTPVWSDLGSSRADRLTPPTRRFDRSGSSSTRARGSGATDWERYVAELREQLDEVHAKLAFAERQLARDGGGSRVPEVGAWRQPAASADDDAVSDAKSTSARPVLHALGRERGLVRLAGRTTHLSRRRTEILVLLASHQDGMTTEELALALYGETGRPASVRTELFRLRQALPEGLYTERNRVKLEIDADFLAVQRLLRTGRAREAAQAYSAAVLPRSEAPGVVDVRHELDAWVRSAVMTSGDREALWAWLESGSGHDDVPAWKRFLADLDSADPRRPFAVSRLARLRNALTVIQ